MAVQIQVTDETWNDLRMMKIRPSETFDDIIRSLIEDNKMRLSQ